MKKKTFTFHIGYPKTATTTLQKYLFATNEKTFYPGKYPPSYDPKNKMVLHFTKMLHEYTKMDFKQSVVDLPILHTLQNSRYNSGLLSEEAIIDKCFTPSGSSNVRQDLKDLMDKISIFSENRNIKIRILITLRRQDELIPSFYAQKYDQFKKAGYPDLSRYVDVLTGSHGKKIGAQALDFHHLFTSLKRIIPTEDIGIVSIHGLQKGEKYSLETLSDFTNNDREDIINALKKRENIRFVNRNTWVSRSTTMLSFFAGIGRAMPISESQRRRIRQSIESWSNITAGKEIRLADTDSCKIQNRYKDSNAHLEAELNRSLF